MEILTAEDVVMVHCKSRVSDKLYILHLNWEDLVLALIMGLTYR
jgi:hypothetical protein